MGFDITGAANAKIPEPDWDIEKEVTRYFDIQRKTPGAYFRASVWDWRPIVQLLYDMKLISEAEADGPWSYNDHEWIDVKVARKIGLELMDWLDMIAVTHEIPFEDFDNYLITKDGTIMGEIEYKEIWIKAPENMEECNLCNGTGNRPDMKEGAWKDKCNGCNGCSGKGKKSKFETSYCTYLSHLNQFADFCINSGGFKIS